MNRLEVVSLFLLYGIFCSLSIEIGDLKSSLINAAGYYTNETLSKLKSLEKTVIVTASNYGYISHLHNFKCHLESNQSIIINFNVSNHA